MKYQVTIRAMCDYDTVVEAENLNEAMMFGEDEFQEKINDGVISPSIEDIDAYDLD